MRESTKKAMEELIEVIGELREKCPWDSVQTLESLKERMASESAEVLEAVDRAGNDQGENLCEELGDVLMLLLLMSRIAEEQGLFTLDDVIRGVSWKMKFRHPKIFPPADPALTTLSWEELKLKEKELRSGRRNNFAGKP